MDSIIKHRKNPTCRNLIDFLTQFCFPWGYFHFRDPRPALWSDVHRLRSFILNLATHLPSPHHCLFLELKPLSPARGSLSPQKEPLTPETPSTLGLVVPLMQSYCGDSARSQIAEAMVPVDDLDYIYLTRKPTMGHKAKCAEPKKNADCGLWANHHC